jgi:YaiO family outer membrane protein
MISVTRGALSCALMFIALPTAYAGVDSVSVQLDTIDYADGHGSRDTAGFIVAGKAGDSSWQIDLTHGQRDFGPVAHSGTRFGGSLHHQWTPRLDTRTALVYSDDSPTFVNREINHDFKLKLIRNTVFNLGGRHAEYYGDTRVTGWSAGADYYFPRITASYRYSHHNVSSGGGGHGNTLSLRLKDAEGRGTSQLWIGHGTSAYAPDLDPLLLRDNRSTSVFLRRSQPLGQHLLLSAGMGKTWHETRFDRFTAVSAQVGMAYHW